MQTASASIAHSAHRPARGPTRLERLKAAPRKSGEASFFFWDAHFRNDAVKVLPGEFFVHDEDILVMTTLGSCIAACLWDREKKIGGMNHFLLPDSADAGSDPARFGVHAMEMLINALMKLGADRRRLEGKLFGGGNVLGSVAQRPTVGERNSTFARAFLAKEHIPLVAERLQSDCGTEVRFWAHTGRVFIRDISTSLLDLSRERKPVLPVLKGGDVELF